jgi:Ribbon-helix-helix protein, copG family
MGMRTITLKIHEFQDEALEEAAKAERVSKSELVRRSLERYLAARLTEPTGKRRNSLHHRLKKYIPKAGTGIRDLASNPKHLDGFGAD